ncbi:MAG: phosphoribosylformylglycinamidine cyclo-ligase, partial [Candidatus Omnitrophica bacterium]|nr:phosphoribosylformylglycinamidine cyclo-ligase [Candidatus Omnitrophota bacterium]
MNYKKSGVNIDLGNALVERIKPLAKSTRIPGLISSIGGFSALFDPSVYKIKNPLLVSTTDGVGTKLEVARLQNRHDTVGIDLVAMNVNDLIVTGARPIFFLDYFATGKLKVGEAADVIGGIAEGCRLAGCALVGGETAEMPGFYHNGEYDLAGFAVGILDRKKVINGSKVKVGDVMLGLASSGPHSNGFSLIRKVFSKEELSGAWGRLALVPTQIYVKPVLAALEKFEVKAMAHITGGGFYDNIPRVLPKSMGAQIQAGSWQIPKIFEEVARRSTLDTKEMYRTFNMGIGMVLVVSSKNVVKAIRHFKQFKIRSWKIGFITEKNQVSVI